MKNKSEMLLEGYLRHYGYRDFDFEPEIPGSSRRPDYRLRWANGEVLLEVKEFHAEPGELAAATSIPIRLCARRSIRDATSSRS